MSGLSFDHLAIPVSDLAAARGFYEGVLGLELVGGWAGDDWEGYPWVMALYALADGRQLALTSFRGAPREPKSHLPTDARHHALAADAIDPWRAWLKAAEIDWREEDHGPQFSLYFEDPDGNVWEITTPPTSATLAPDPDAARVLDAWIANA